MITIRNFSARTLVVGVVIVFVYVGLTGGLTAQTIENVFMFIAGAVFGRGRAPLPEKDKSP
jgi:hypothetical protein